MQLSMNGVAVVIPDADIENIVRDRILTPIALCRTRLYVVPKIGEYWQGQGGIYAGTRRGLNSLDYHLIFAEPEFKGNWQASMDWAKALMIDGHKDFELPDRGDQSVLFGNAGEHFKKEWHWSRVQHAAHADSAWLQGFNDGTQTSYHKGSEFVARAVRRLVIE